MRRRASLVVLVMLGVPGTAIGEVGLLGGPPAAELGRSLASQGQKVLGPTKVARRLARSPEVRRALKTTRASIQSAEKSTLYMKRAASLAAARRALRSLAAVAGRRHAGKLTAQAQVARALALLLQPSDEEAAYAAFRAAVAADPTYQPDPDRLPSKAARLLRQARRAPQRPTMATAKELATITRLAGLKRLVWVEATRGGGLRWQIFHRRRGAITHRGRAVDDLQTALATAPKTAVPRTTTPQATTPATQPESRPVATDVGPTPWYKRWWVWTLVGVAVVGAGVGVAVAATTPADRSYVFRFEY